MPYKRALVVFLLFFFQKSWCTVNHVPSRSEQICFDSLGVLVSISPENITNLSYKNKPSPLLKNFRARQQKNKKIIATLLAFPFPFGIVGLHRIYLGCPPYVPVAYIASLGGMFGVLPFIDFCVLLAAKKTDLYINNDKIFMWVN